MNLAAPALIERVIALREQGFDLRTIARRTHVSHEGARLILLRNQRTDLLGCAHTRRRREFPKGTTKAVRLIVATLKRRKHTTVGPAWMNAERTRYRRNALVVNGWTVQVTISTAATRLNRNSFIWVHVFGIRRPWDASHVAFVCGPEHQHVYICRVDELPTRQGSIRLPRSPPSSGFWSMCYRAWPSRVTRG